MLRIIKQLSSNKQNLSKSTLMKSFLFNFLLKVKLKPHYQSKLLLIGKIGKVQTLHKNGIDIVYSVR